MKKQIMLILLIGGVVASSEMFAKKLGTNPKGVGIQDYELKKAMDLALKNGYMDLFTSMGGVAPKPPIIKFTEEEIQFILWPVLVFAIEEGNQQLIYSIMRDAPIYTDSKKPAGPSGRTPTPVEISDFLGKPYSRMMYRIDNERGHRPNK